jgi:SMODS-associated and fused to various effectors sensor domain
LLTRTLGFSEATDSLDELREMLDPLFRIVGLRRVPAHQSAFIYDEVAFRWLAQGRLEFDRDGLRAACAREDLIDDGPGDAPLVYGVKSFEHPIDRLEDRCVAVLDLVPEFDDRFIRPEVDWATVLYPALKAFLLDAASKSSRLRLSLDAHLTLAFTAGSVLNIKSGKAVELEQRMIARSVWSVDDFAHDPAWPSWAFGVEALPGDGQEMAVAICLTHEIASAVRTYVTSTLPGVGSMLVARLSTGPGARSVAAGRHAFELAEALTAQVRAMRSHGVSPAMLHLFMAGPGGFAFFLGQRQAAFGRLTLYEFDFEGSRSGSYQPSLVMPVAAGVAGGGKAAALSFSSRSDATVSGRRQ